jgi:hypothetical protein
MSTVSSDGATFSDIWSNNVILAYVDRSEGARKSEFNPSFGYTFRREAMPEIDFYYENGGKLKLLERLIITRKKLSPPTPLF